jgi:hypothetical protein
MATAQENSTISIVCLEHQILEHVKQALRVTLNWQAPAVSMPRKLGSLQFTIKSFQRHLERLMRIEEEGGYMSEVLDAKPHLQPRVEKLATDHARFRHRLGQLLPELNDIKDWEEQRFEQVCGEVRSLLDRIDRHDLCEIELMQESLLTDDGGEG